MSKIIDRMKLNLLFIFILTFLSSPLFCTIIEDQNLTISNITNPNTLKAIPNSYFIFGSNKINTSDGGFRYDFCVLDAKNIQFLGHMNYPELTSDFDILPVDNGWNAYLIFQDNMNFGKIHIDSSGMITSHERLLPWQDANHFPLVFGYQEKNELFLFGKKIYKYIPGSLEFEVFNLPEGWVQGKAINQYNLLEGTSKILLFGGGSGCIWDLDSNVGQILPEMYNVNSIKFWNNHPGKYICLASGVLASFDPETLHFEVLFSALATNDLAIDDTGSIFYSYIKDSNSLIVLDLDKKTYQLFNMNINVKLQRIITDNWFLIPGKDKILTVVATKDSPDSWNETFETALIDLHTNEMRILKSVDNTLITHILLKKTDYIFYPDFDIVIADDFQGSLGLLDVETETLKPILQFGFSAGFGNNKPLYIRDQFWLKNTPCIMNSNPSIGKRDIHYMGNDFVDWCMYPDETGFVISIYHNQINSLGYSLMEYTLSDGSSRVFDIPLADYRYGFYRDVTNKRIIAIYNDQESNFFQMQYIKGFNDYSTWAFPDLDTEVFAHAFDKAEGSTWLSYGYQTKTGLGFMKIMSWDQPYLDHFYQDLNAKYGSISLYNNGEFLITLVQDYLYTLDPGEGKVLFKTQIFGANVPYTKVEDSSIVSIPEKDGIFFWDGDLTWKIDTKSWTLVYGSPIQNTQYNSDGVIVGDYDYKNDELVFFDTAKTNSIVIVDPDSGSIKKTILINTGMISSETCKNPKFDLDRRSIYFLKEQDGFLTTVRLDDDWDKAPTIKPQGQFVEYRPGDNFKLILDIANPADTPQDVTAYIWFWLPTEQYVFFGPNGLTTDVVGIPVTLPANLDTSVSLDLFTVPIGMSSGFYNLNAAFFNNRTTVRGPMGTYNFMAGE